MGIQTTLDAMREAGSILLGMRAADDLTVSASRDGGVRAVRLLAEAAVDPLDQLTAIAAIHALAEVFDESAGEALVTLLDNDTPFIREHAAWALGARLPRFDAISGLVSLVIAGGFSGMVAQRTLEQWARSAPEHVALALEGTLVGVAGAEARSRLVETIGLAPGRVPVRLLRRIAVDPGEATEVRVAAIAALGDLEPHDSTLAIVTELAGGDDVLADVARLALTDLVDLTGRDDRSPPRNRGATVAQLFLHADIDRALSQVGAGDNGGIATLLVRLGDALVAEEPSGRRQIDRVLTLSRGGFADALGSLSEAGSARAGHAYAAVPFHGEPVASVDAWPRRIATERGIRRILKAAGAVDAIHLRMADVGTLAASTVARELGIPIVFTLAPDPHGAIRSLHDSGALTRANFGSVDAVEHFWFRVRLLERTAADAAHTVVFPRPDLHRDLRDLVGIDLTQHPERHSVIAEGIDLALISRARADAAAQQSGDAGTDARSSDAGNAAFAELDELLATLPPERRMLPLAITVGRLHRVKGMATLVKAWAADSALSAACNLLIVGGDLHRPSVDERAQLNLINAAVPLDDAAARGLLLAGHRGNDTVARWLAAVRTGRPDLAAPNGVYACASVKEEFGIALLEAMATGLPVVAPNGGGPATYVEDGVTGFLVNTGDPAALAGGITAALAIASGPLGPDYAVRAAEMVAGSFTIQAMASTLAAVYGHVSFAGGPNARALSAS